MKKCFFVLSLFCVIFSGCTRLILYHYGVRNPRVETHETVVEYLKSEHLDTSDLYALKDTSSFNRFNTSGIGMPEMRFYDQHGYLMLYRDNKRCNAQNDSLISFLNPANIIRIDSTSNFYTYMDDLRTLNGEVLNKESFEGYDFYLVMYWAKWLGKMNSVKMSDWEKSLALKNDLKIKTIKVTTDYMDFWKVREKDMIKVYGLRTVFKDEKKGKR